MSVSWQRNLWLHLPLDIKQNIQEYLKYNMHIELKSVIWNKLKKNNGVCIDCNNIREYYDRPYLTTTYNNQGELVVHELSCKMCRTCLICLKCKTEHLLKNGYYEENYNIFLCFMCYDEKDKEVMHTLFELLSLRNTIAKDRNYLPNNTIPVFHINFHHYYTKYKQATKAIENIYEGLYDLHIIS